MTGGVGDARRAFPPGRAPRMAQARIGSTMFSSCVGPRSLTARSNRANARALLQKRKISGVFRSGFAEIEILIVRLARHGQVGRGNDEVVRHRSHPSRIVARINHQTERGSDRDLNAISYCQKGRASSLASY